MARKETLKVSVTVQPDDWWKQRLADIRREGLRVAKEYRRGRRHFHLENLSLRQVRGGDTVQLTVAKMELDWKIATKLEMAKAARDIIEKSYTLGSLDLALQTILISVIEEKGLYEHNIGEFFLLYGRFEQKYKVFSGEETREKMKELMQGKKKYLKPYKDQSGKEYSDNPLPYTVRNILAHVGNAANSFTVEEIKTSIKLLKSWSK